jgi:hypothetical protein
VDSPRSKDTDVNSFSVEDRDANSIINSELAVKSNPKIKDGNFRPYTDSSDIP